MRFLPLVFSIGLLAAGCFSPPAETPVEDVAPASPAQRAEADLTAMQARLNALPMPERTALRAHAPLCAAVQHHFL